MGRPAAASPVGPQAWGSGEQVEGTSSRADDGEMAVIEGADSSDGQPLGRGDDRRVDGAERKVPVSGYELDDAEPVHRSHGLG